jgi:hypothetical protein
VTQIRTFHLLACRKFVREFDAADFASIRGAGLSFRDKIRER